MGSARVSSNLTGVDFLTFAVLKMRKKIHPPGIEPGTYRVLGGRHNQLDHGCLHLQYPGFEPGLPRPQRGVLTTILILLVMTFTLFWHYILMHAYTFKYFEKILCAAIWTIDVSLIENSFSPLWGISSIGRVRRLQRWGTGIETRILHYSGPIV